VKWVLLGLMALFALVLCLRVGVRVRLDKGAFTAWVMAGPKPVQIYPAKQKKADTEPDKPKEKKKAPSGEKKPGSRLTVDILCQYAKLALSALGALVRGLRVDLLRLYAVIHCEDAAETAIRYGSACAAVTGVLPVLDNVLEIKKKDIQIDAGFQEEGSLLLEVQITAAIGRLLAIGLVYVFKFILLQRKVKKNEQSQRNDA